MHSKQLLPRKGGKTVTIVHRSTWPLWFKKQEIECIQLSEAVPVNDKSPGTLQLVANMAATFSVASSVP